MIKTRLALPVLVASAALVILAGCGGTSSSSSAPATVAPPESSLFIEGTLRPSGSLKSNIEALAKNVAGVEDLGGRIVAEIEKTAKANGEPFKYSEDVEPWLGEKAGLAFEKYDGSNFSNYMIALQSTDTGATQEFIEKLKEEGGESDKEGSYEGVDFTVESGSGTTVGLIGDFLVLAQNEKTFKDAVDASKGENLAGQDAYTSVASHAPSGALLGAWVNIGGLIEQSGGEVDEQTEELLKTAGIELDQATALVSLVPGSNTVELDLVSDLGGGEVVSPPAEALLESMPGPSFAAVSATDYGKRLQEGIDSLDASGIPGQVPPHQLKETLKKAGIDLEAIAGSLEEAAVFAVGSSRSSLGGALVLTTKNATEAKNTVANIGLLLRSNHTPGVTAISGKAAGFSIRSAELGSKPIVVAAKGERIAIGYGLPATLEGLGPVSPTLAENAAFTEAKKALGGTPISGFVDGKAALHLADALVSPLESGFRQARPYLEKIDYIGFGGGTEGKLATLKLVVGLER
ncbi:MAG: DUF3352 domain-containing protein [Solirubrobacterales bacterium]